jgi:hypothetical protein
MVCPERTCILALACVPFGLEISPSGLQSVCRGGSVSALRLSRVRVLYVVLLPEPLQENVVDLRPPVRLELTTYRLQGGRSTS